MDTMGKLKKGIQSLLLRLPLQNIILFESSPDFACNTYPVYLQMKEKLPKYKLVWAVAEEETAAKGKDAFCFYGNSFRSRIRSVYCHYFAKAMISSNRIFEKKRPQQVNLFLCHGSKTKRTRGSYEVGEDVDYVNVQSHFFDDIITYEYNCTKEKLVYLGYPRCDWLYQGEEESRKCRQKLFGGEECQFVVWLPTYRKHARSHVAKQMDTQRYDSIGMPLVYSQEQLSRLDEFLAKRNLHLLFKPHPAQDISGLKAADLSHIRILTDEKLAQMDLQLYQVLGASAGLITDYSSVFFDYLLTDKPIATTTDDIEAWKGMTGFAFDLDAFLDKATTRVPTLEALEAHLDALVSGRDDKAAGRKEIRGLTNTYFDGDSAQRVADFIIEKLGGRNSRP